MNKNQANINYKSVCCKKIPDLFLDKLIAKTHFGKFGKISRFILRPNRFMCTVEYETEEAAERALVEGTNFNGYEFIIEYAEHEVAHVQNTEEWVDPDVQAELDIMYTGHWTQRKTLHTREAFVTLPAPSPKISFAKFHKQKLMQGTANFGNGNESETPKINENVRAELESQMRKQAFTDEEKYRVLDARDKLIRLKTKRQTDIKKVQVTEGKCPDMCPEKERLMREFQRQVSLFELSRNNDESTKISHKFAIKQYSRSSADQEVPLSHELRPEIVLELTMLYLTHKIMDLCNDPYVSIGDWFHFVWDRTRSIRKDITQQELCSLRAVKLVEQCARFHIHCAGRLIGEDPSVFDNKINMENLTKCLQTLKYMYHDLRLKKIFCPCEAEFRSYVILLNLGDSNFLWELKHLPENIQKHRAIRRAITFYNALQNNNYVRFFKMLRSDETSYLSACILLNYFTRLRLRALAAIGKTYTGRKNYGYLPITYITHILGFEDGPSAIDFLEYHGLNCEKDVVVVDTIRKPNLEYTMNRAFKLVESKCKVSVGECINAGRLESFVSFEKHRPHNSFDEDGYLKENAWTAEDQLQKLQVESDKIISETPSVFVKPQIKTPSPRNLTSNFENIFKIPTISSPIQLKQSYPRTPPPVNKDSKINDEVILPQLSAPVSNNLNTSNTFSLFSPIKIDNAFKFTKVTKVANDSNIVMEKAKIELQKQQTSDKLFLQMEQKRTLELKMRNIDNLAANITETLLISHVATEISAIAHSEIAKLERFESVVSYNYNTIFNDVINAETKEIMWDEYLQEMCHKRLLKRLFLIWLNVVRDNCRIRKLISESSTRLLRHPFETENLNFMKRYRQGQSCDFTSLLRDDIFMKNSTTSTKLNIFELLSRCFADKMPLYRNGLLQKRKYFKLLVSVPDAMDELPNFNVLYDKWFNEDIYVPSQPHNPNNEFGYICAMQNDIGLCVRKITGIRLYNENRQVAQNNKNECSNADAVIFLMTCFNLRNTIKRLKLFLASMKNKKPIPIALIVYNGKCDEELLAEHIGLVEWYESETLTSHKFYGCHETKSTFNFRLIFEDAIHFLCKETLQLLNDRNKLEMQTIQSWLETNLGEEIWQLWELSRQNNPAFAKLCQKPNNVISTYHEALKNLKQMLNFDYGEWSELAEELKVLLPEPSCDVICSFEYFPNNWTNTRKEELYKFFEAARLPKLIDILPNDMKELQLYMLQYGYECIPGNYQISTIASYETIRALINELNRFDVTQLDLKQGLSTINYLPVIKAMVFQRINYLLSNDFHNSLPCHIIYMRDESDEYKNKPWWLHNENMENIIIDSKQTEFNNISFDQHNPVDNDLNKDLESVLSVCKRSARKAIKRLKILKNDEIENNETDVNFSITFKMEKNLKDCIQQFEITKQATEEQIKSYLDSYDIEENSKAASYLPKHGSTLLADSKENNEIVTYKRRRYSEKGEDRNVSVAAAISRAQNLLERFEKRNSKYN